MQYENWIDFTFGIDAQSSLLRLDDYPGTPRELAIHCTRLFRNSRQVLSEVSAESASAAFSLIPGIDGYLGVLARPDVPLANRMELCDAHFELFSDAFSINDYDGAAFMWWERLRGAEYGDGPPVESDEVICNRLIKVLERILTIKSERCQRSALHGIHEIGPFGTCDATEIVKVFLEQHTDISAFVKQYATDVINGDAQ